MAFSFRRKRVGAPAKAGDVPVASRVIAAEEGAAGGVAGAGEVEHVPTMRESIRALPAPLWILVFGYFINYAGALIVIVLALYVHSLGYSPAVAGGVISTMFAGKVFAGVIGGQLADRIGRRFTIVLSMVCSGLVASLFAVFTGLPAIFILSFLFGVAGSIYVPAANALVGDILDPKYRIAGYSVVSLGAEIGIAVSGVVAGFLATHSFTVLFLADAATSFTFAIAALLFLPKGGTTIEEEKVEKRSTISLVLVDIRFQIFLLCIFLLWIIQSQWFSSLPLQVKDYGHSYAFFGVLWSFVGLLGIFAQIVLTAQLPRYKATASFAFGSVLLGLGAGLVAVSSSFGPLLVVTAMMEVGELIIYTISPAYVTEIAPEGRKGRYQGVTSTVTYLGQFVGPVMMGLVFSINTSAVWVICGILGAVSAGLISVNRGHRTASARGEEAA
jgi:MFS family permease